MATVCLDEYIRVPLRFEMRVALRLIAMQSKATGSGRTGAHPQSERWSVAMQLAAEIVEVWMAENFRWRFGVSLSESASAVRKDMLRHPGMTEAEAARRLFRVTHGDVRAGGCDGGKYAGRADGDSNEVRGRCNA